MKKLFWVTTALVTLGGISVAAADVSISGNTRFRYHAWSDDIASGAGRNNSAFADDLQPVKPRQISLLPAVIWCKSMKGGDNSPIMTRAAN